MSGSALPGHQLPGATGAAGSREVAPGVLRPEVAVREGGATSGLKRAGGPVSRTTPGPSAHRMVIRRGTRSQRLYRRARWLTGWVLCLALAGAAAYVLGLLIAALVVIYGPGPLS